MSFARGDLVKVGDDSSMTPQDRGRQWEQELCRLVGGRQSVGSGNQVNSVLDVGVNGLLVIEAKSTEHESFRVTTDLLEHVANQAGGMAAGSRADWMLAIRLGAAQRRVALVDLDVLVGWLREPPGLLEATPRQRMRAAARAPSLLRGT